MFLLEATGYRPNLHHRCAVHQNQVSAQEIRTCADK